MPRGDQTGPAGMGPMSGRGAGYCAGEETPGYANDLPRMGRGRRFGGRAGRWTGRSWGRGARRASFGPQQDEATWLKSQANHLESTLKQIQQRLANLEQD